MIYVELVSQIRANADVVLCLGSRLGETDWWGKPPYWRSPRDQRMIQVDVDAQVLGANKPADLPVLADVRVFLTRPIAAGGAGADSHAKRNQALKMRREAASAASRRRADDRSEPMNQAAWPRVPEVHDDAILVTDGRTPRWANLPLRSGSPYPALRLQVRQLGAGCAQALGAAVA
jgi:acetolactate synthase-1/2/3 large subunit